jgi:hypothetical protein
MKKLHSLSLDANSSVYGDKVVLDPEKLEIKNLEDVLGAISEIAQRKYMIARTKKATKKNTRSYTH